MVYTFRNLETGGPHFDTPGYCKMVDAWAQELIQSVYISFPYEKCLAMGMSIEARSQTVCRPCLTQITTDNEEVRKVMAGHSAEDLPFMQDEDVVKVFAQLRMLFYRSYRNVSEAQSPDLSRRCLPTACPP